MQSSLLPRPPGAPEPPPSSAALGCIVVPLVLAFFLYSVWPSQADRAKWRDTVNEIEADVRGQGQVRSTLRDPGSAEFSDGQPGRVAGVRCGWVNANNAVGGRAGRQRYITASHGTIFEEQVGPVEMDAAWQQLC